MASRTDGPIARLREACKPGGRVVKATLLRVAARVREKARQAFDDQGRAGKAWAPRSVPNVAGLLEDAKNGATVKDRRFETRPAGLDTGRLRNSIQTQIEEPSRIVVGSNLPYASTFAQGGPSKITISETQRQNLERMAKKDRRLRGPLNGKKIRKIIAGVVTELTIQLPPRPFLIVTDQDRQEFQAIALDEIRKEIK